MRSITDDAPQKIWHSFNWGLNPTEADSKIAHTRHRYPGCSVKYTKVQKWKNLGTDYRKIHICHRVVMRSVTDDTHQKIGTASTEG